VPAGSLPLGPRPSPTRAFERIRHVRVSIHRYAAVRDAQCVPEFCGRIGWIDVTALTADADIARRAAQVDPVVARRVE